MRIFHQNIQGLLTKLPLLELCVDEFREGGKELHVLCFSEIFVEKGTELNIILRGFKLVSSYCRSKSRGGTCILIRNNLKSKPLTVVSKLALEISKLES